MDQKTLESKPRYQLQTLLDDCRIEQPRGLRLLEVGFARGGFLLACHDAGIETVGLEVDPILHRILAAANPELDLILYDGNAIPLPDASFDIVVSYQVLEHVGSLKTTLAECVRLLKPGGIMYHVFPNYHSFYEGHYKILWLPFLNQAAGRCYLKLLRKYTPFYESLNIVKPAAVRRIMAAHQDTVDVLSLGRDEFKSRFNPHQIAKVHQPLIRGILKAVHSVPLLRRMLLAFMCGCNLYYPITLIARKKPSPASPGNS